MLILFYYESCIEIKQIFVYLHYLYNIVIISIAFTVAAVVSFVVANIIIIIIIIIAIVIAIVIIHFGIAFWFRKCHITRTFSANYLLANQQLLLSYFYSQISESIL